MMSANARRTGDAVDLSRFTGRPGQLGQYVNRHVQTAWWSFLATHSWQAPVDEDGTDTAAS